MERLTHTDAEILGLEDDVCAAHGLTIGVFEGAEPAYDDLLERVSDRVRLVPRYRQRLMRVPLELERPVWTDDPNFSIDFHVRHTALPQRRDRNALYAFVSRVLSSRIDRGKPLWELWMVSGLPDDRWALVSKVHYAILDGVSGTDLLGLLADSIEADPRIGQRMPEPLPTSRELVVDAITDMALDPLTGLRMAGDIARRPLALARLVSAGWSSGRHPDGLGRASGPHRRWRSAQVSLAELREVRERYGCTTTDVILAGVAGGIRNYLTANGKPMPDTVKALVPLAVGAVSGGLSGQITTLTAHLPIAEPDGKERLRLIHEQTSAGAAEHDATAGHVLRRQDDFVAPTILGQGVRSTMLEARNHPSIDTVAINVPGPAETITVLGRPMLETYPVIPLPGQVRIAVAAMSLGDQVYFGITADWDTTSGIRHAASGITDTIAEL